MNSLINLVDNQAEALTLIAPGVAPLVLTRDGFIYKGKTVDDHGKAYELFFAAMTQINAQALRMNIAAEAKARQWDWLCQHVARVHVDGRITWILTDAPTDDATQGVLFAEVV